MPDYEPIVNHDPWRMYERAKVCSGCGAVVAPGKTNDHEAHHQAIEEMLTALRG